MRGEPPDWTGIEVYYAVLVGLMVAGFAVLAAGLVAGVAELRVGGTVLVALVLFSSPSGRVE